MKEYTKCIFCGYDVASRFKPEQLTYICNCKNCGYYRISFEAIHNLPYEIETNLKNTKHLISGYLHEMTDLKTPVELITTDNLKKILESSLIPKTTKEKMDKALMTLFRKTNFLGEQLNLHDVEYPAIAYAVNKTELDSILQSLKNRGYLSYPAFGLVTLTPEGYEKAENAANTVREGEKTVGTPQFIREVILREPPKAIDTNKVFIVHGHDEGVRHSVARMIEKLNLSPIILHEQPSQNRTIIEKVVAYSDVGFAVVLLTPDDSGKANQEEDYQPRARQNVILEWGYFLGKLGRERVCALYTEGVELPSDINGVLWIPLDKQGGWQLILARELKAAGLDVDLNKLG